MTQDWMYAEPLGLYVVADVDGAVVRSLEMTGRKPSSAAKRTPFIKALERYFATGKDDFSRFSPDYSGMTPFKKRVLQELRKVPAGSTVAYGELAAIAGKPGAARAVGNVMATNPTPLLVPCHRVIASDGGIGGWSGEGTVKRALLHHEKAKGF